MKSKIPQIYRRRQISAFVLVFKKILNIKKKIKKKAEAGDVEVL